MYLLSYFFYLTEQPESFLVFLEQGFQLGISFFFLDGETNKLF